MVSCAKPGPGESVPPAGVPLRVFRPIKPLPVGAFTVAQKRIEAALALGHDEALEQVKLEAEG